MSALILFVGNSSFLELQALTTVATGALDLGATVTGTLYDADGSEVAGQVWPVAMALVVESPSTGKYRGSLESDIVISPNRRYTAVVNATGSGGEVGKWTSVITPSIRGPNQ
jgi:hypothetical protein